MILSRIEIENFKQYSGDHELDVPGQATIGVIGENGTGKTTLFEAIEWCLYNPRAMRNEDVRPRGVGGTTTVRVYLESLDGSHRFVVERILKRAPTATIFRFDAEGDAEPIVNGARQVSDYVASHLIGLSHRAFTATFFTRQKELHLFEDEAPMKRREQIGRLLGLETIRAAQVSIGADRAAANAEARALHIQYERESLGRDLKAERSLALDAIASAQALHQQSLHAAATSTVQRGEAEEHVAAIQHRRDQHRSLTTARDKILGEQQLRKERIDQIVAELHRLDRVAIDRAEQLGLAERYPALASEHRQQEGVRQRFELRMQSERAVAETSRVLADHQRLLRALVSSVGTPSPHAAWTWTGKDEADQLRAIDRLLAVARGADPERLEQVERDLQACSEVQARLAAERLRLVQYQERRSDLERQIGDHLANGDPNRELVALDRRREALVEERSRVVAELTAAQAERERTVRLIANVEDQVFGDACPTCGRAFSESDAGIVLDSLREKALALLTRIATLNADQSNAEASIGECAAIRQRIMARVATIDDIRQRLDRSVGFIAEQQHTVMQAEQDLATRLTRLGRTSVPTEEERSQASTATRRARSLANCEQTLVSYRSVVSATLEKRSSSAAVLTELSDVTFDPEAFGSLTAELSRADRARTSVQHMDQDLARRPSLDGEVQILERDVAGADRRQKEIEHQSRTLAYEEGELVAARSALASAQQRERAAVQSSHQAELTLQNARARLESVESDERRLRDLAELGDRRKREFEELDQMVKEFAEFERFALSRKLPVLADITSQLVAAVTDGKYDRVDFDQDFGIMVGDGGVTDETFALATFSGGERDAITLAARIALSHMIGRGAANPPGFLVLDEVFGSLDSDRRARLMDLLGSITNQFDELRQVFIISHVDDVRSSPVLDELWRIEEAAGGGSRITALAAGTEIETL
jgi:exonuclease SbcC